MYNRVDGLMSLDPLPRDDHTQTLHLLKSIKGCAEPDRVMNTGCAGIFGCIPADDECDGSNIGKRDPD